MYTQSTANLGQWGALAKLKKMNEKRDKNSYSTTYCAADVSRVGTCHYERLQDYRVISLGGGMSAPYTRKKPLSPNCGASSAPSAADFAMGL